MKLNLTIFSLITIFFSCSPSVELINTKWQYDWGEGTADEISFDKQNYMQYSAEIGEHYYGTYSIKGDTVILNQECGEFDHEFPLGSHHIAGKATSKLIIKNNDQLGYAKMWLGDRWEEDFYFTKVE